MDNLADKKCVPCEGGVMPLTIQEAEKLLMQIDSWDLDANARRIQKEFSFKNFADALAFANRVGEIAEEENHHPDLHVSWGKVAVELSTHAIGGLSENDFVLAAKIDQVSSQ
jgi:4a-hydroxytetrahydrobiopterin dehydratase